MIAAFMADTTSAQLSPGDLHRAHAFLDGVANCAKCHDRDRGELRAKCLDCHSAIRARIAAGQGLHAQPDYRDCQHCHVEHQGRDFALVWWPEGDSAFDHALTGYVLRGRHIQAPCRACHRPENMRDAAPLVAQKKDLARTYLGLDTTCLSCHHDEHRGQLASTCQQCHTLDGWTPAPGFDHGRTKFALTGKHTATACAKCHETVPDPGQARDTSYLRLANVKHGNCTDCHQDTHGGRFGGRCESCHNTGGWTVTQTAAFDHARARYPLEGAHRQVACEKCHPAGQKKTGLKFARCLDCHQDHHKGEFAHRSQQGACEECHTVAGFAPALFTIEQHAAGDFALREAHLAVPCNACHSSKAAPFAGRRAPFTWSATHCQDCHPDVHKGTLARMVERDGCDGCHSESAWSAIAFNHDSTAFPLRGRHASAVCAACHKGDTTVVTIARLAFAPMKRDCESCHRDIHRGQFAVTDSLPATRCDRCHTSENWRPERFDHSRTEYPLDGAHAKAPCSGCHKPSTVDGAPFVNYQIADRTCRACHGADTVVPAGGPR